MKTEVFWYRFLAPIQFVPYSESDQLHKCFLISFWDKRNDGFNSYTITFGGNTISKSGANIVKDKKTYEIICNYGLFAHTFLWKIDFCSLNNLKMFWDICLEAIDSCTLGRRETVFRSRSKDCLRTVLIVDMRHRYDKFF